MEGGLIESTTLEKKRWTWKVMEGYEEMKKSALGIWELVDGQIDGMNG